MLYPEEPQQPLGVLGNRNVLLPLSWAVTGSVVLRVEDLKGAPGSSVTSRNVSSFL